jgi:hypothetical protein
MKKMSKYNRIAIVCGMVLLVIVGTPITAFAGEKPNGKPFEEIREELDDIQNQIDMLEPIPGPQGPMGPMGPKGDPGPPGDSFLPVLVHTGEDYHYWDVPSTSWAIIRTVTLTIASGGYILLTFSGNVIIETDGGWVDVGIDDTQMGVSPDTIQCVLSQDADDWIPFSVHYVYEVSSNGTYTYYGKGLSGDDVSDIYGCRMTALFVPNGS